jgi:Leucine-rich repeat (LRR) protein
MSDGTDFLVELYERTSGPKWRNSSGWAEVKAPAQELPDVNGTPAHLYNCHGTTFDKEVLTKIILLENELEGVLPPSFATSLSWINLSANSLIGEIPSAIGTLLHLEYLSMFGNRLTGTIPIELGNCKMLKSLYLHANRLEGSVPDCLGALPLIHLNLSHNNLNHAEFIPDFLARITTLQQLNLTAPYICRVNRQQSGAVVRKDVDQELLGPMKQRIPRNIGVELASLTSLECSNTNMSGTIPESLLRIKTLKLLRLSFNRLTGEIHPGIGDLVRLQTLDLESNRISGVLPDTVSSLRSLSVLKLRYNEMAGRPPTASLIQCKRLRTLDLRSNQFEVPEGKNLWTDDPKRVFELLQSGASTFTSVLADSAAAAAAVARASRQKAKAGLMNETTWLLQRGCKPEEVDEIHATSGKGGDKRDRGSPSSAARSSAARSSSAKDAGRPLAKGFPRSATQSQSQSHLKPGGRMAKDTMSLPTIIPTSVISTLRPIRSPKTTKATTEYRTNVGVAAADEGGALEGVFSLDSGAFEPALSRVKEAKAKETADVVVTTHTRISASSLVQSVRATAEDHRASRWEEHERLVGACLDVTNPCPRYRSGFGSQVRAEN